MATSTSDSGANRILLATIAFLVAAAGGAGVHSSCDKTSIWNDLRQVQIADYEPSASPPPPFIAGQLYSAISDKVAECADGSSHFAGSSIGDLTEAAAFAYLAAESFFDGERTPEACAALRQGLRYTESAKSLASSLKSPNAQEIKTLHRTSATLRALFGSRCR